MTWEDILSAIQAVQSLTTVEEMAAAIAQIESDIAALLETSTNAEEPEAELAKADGVELALSKVKANVRAKVDLAKRAKEAVARRQSATIAAAPIATATTTPEVRTKPGKRSRVFKSDEDAYVVGLFLRTLHPDHMVARDAEQRLQERGLNVRTMNSGNNASLGLLVPDQMQQAIWDLQEDAGGVARRVANVINMTGPTYSFIKNLHGAEAFPIGEVGAPTSSEISLSTLTMTAKTWGALSYYSKELEADAMASVADLITQDFARQFAVKEDDCYFNGTGTGTYHGNVGCLPIYRHILEAAGGTWTNDTHKGYLGSLYVQPGTNTVAGLVVSDLSKAESKLARYPGIAPIWMMHPTVAFDVIRPLFQAAPGNDASFYQNGTELRINGYPVELVEAMPEAAGVAGNTPYILFGDAGLATNFGVREEVSIESQSSGTNFENRIVSVLGTERFGVLVHDAGNYSASAATRKRGALVAITTKN
jgi:HK97 family phage major capsid protein